MLKPKKSFGQNFLKSKDIAKNIVELLNISQNDTIIEIGPGRGALTDFLYKKPKNLILVELDIDIFRLLASKYNEAILLNQDASTIEISSSGNNLKIIGNLPYNMYTNILINMVRQRSFISKMVFMLQKEVSERLISSSKDKSWLWAYINTFFDVRYAMSVPGRFFYPMPKVTSGVIVLDKKPSKEIEDDKYMRFLKNLYKDRRKMLKQKIDIEETHAKKRVEELTLEDIIHIYKTFSWDSKNLLTSAPAL